MANLVGELKVIFSGLWRAFPQTDVEKHLRIISQEYLNKPGIGASLQLTSSGVELHILGENGLTVKTKKIDLNNIYDVIVNKYHPLCLMVVHADPKYSHIFLVCQTHHESEGLRFCKAFHDFKYRQGTRNSKNDVNRHNWVLKPKQVSNNNEGESESLTSTEKAESVKDASGNKINNVLHTSSVDSSGYHSVLVHQTSDSNQDDEVSLDSQTLESLPSQNGYFDSDSMVSLESYNSMKEELFNLSQEVRNIKVLLEKQGINPDTLQQNGGGDVNGHAENGEKHSPSSSPKSGASDRKVNFAVDEHKGLSESGRKGLYVKKQIVASATSRGKLPIRPHYYRTSSSGNSSNSPTSPVYIGPNEVFGAPAPVQVPSGQPVHQTAHQRKDSKHSLGTTVQKPIEQVYHSMQPRQSHSVRRQVVHHSGQSSTLPAHRRTPDSNSRKNGHF